MPNEVVDRRPPGPLADKAAGIAIWLDAREPALTQRSIPGVGARATSDATTTCARTRIAVRDGQGRYEKMTVRYAIFHYHTK